MRASLGLSLVLALSLAACSRSNDSLIAEGRTALDKGEYNAAIIAFKNAVQQSPDSLPARLALAEGQERAGNLVDAEQQLRRALSLGGKPGELIPHIAALMLDRNETAKLINEFAAQKLDDPRAQADLKAALATAYLTDRKLDAAKAALAGVENTPWVRVAQAQILAIEGKRDETLQAVDALSSEKTLPWHVLRSASRLYGSLGQTDKSLATLQRALDAAPEHTGLQGELAEAYLNARRVDDARKVHAKLMKSAPKYYRTMYIDAFLKQQDGRRDEAHAQASRVLALIPDHVPSLLIAGDVELGRGEFSAAEAHARKALQQRSDLLEARRMLAQALLNQKKTDEAAEVIDKGLLQAPADETLLGMKAELQWSSGKKSDAVATLQKSLGSASAKKGMTTIRLAEMLFAQGQTKEATGLLRDAEQAAGQDMALRERIFQVALKAGQREQAQRMADEAVKAQPNAASPLMWQAALAGSAGQQDTAFDYCRKALAVQADFYPALMALRSAANTPERRQELRGLMDKAVASGSKDARIYLEYAGLLRVSGATAEDIAAALDKGIAAQPGSVALRSAATRLWLVQGKPDKAMQVAQDGFAANPNSAAMESLLASVLDSAGDHEQAATRYGQLAARYPDQASLRIREADALMRADQAPQALEVLKKAIVALPDDLSLHSTLASLQAQQGALQDALVTASIIRDRKAWAAYGYLLQGDIQAQAKRFDEAFKSYAAAAEAGAELRAKQGRIVLLDRTSDGPKADKELRDWLSAHPNDADMLVFAAQRAGRLGKPSEAVSYLQKLQAQRPDNVVVLNDLAWAQLQAGDKAALSNARKARELAPENPNVLDTLGVILSRSGQGKEGVAVLQQALSLAPGTPIYALHLAEAMLANGDKAEAKKVLDGLNEKIMDADARKQLALLKTKV